jgi:hypothetical protein
MTDDTRQDESDSDAVLYAALKMERWGSGFAAAIASAYFKADKKNTRRLFESFGHLFEQYYD